MGRWLVACLVGYGGCLATHAAGLQISPVGLSLPAAQRAGVLTLGNLGSEPVTVQARAFRWTQGAQGEDVLTPATGLLVSPPMAQIGVQSEQQFRVIRTQPAGVKEEAYRILIDELPVPSADPKKGLQLVLRYSVPVFLNADPYPETTLKWQLSPVPGEEGKTLLSVHNTGTARAQLSRAWLDHGEGQPRQMLSQGLMGYVLPGSTLRRVVAAPVSDLRSPRFTIVVNGREVHPESDAATAP